MRVLNPRDKQGQVLRYIAFLAFEYNGFIKGEKVDLEANTLKEARILTLEYIFRRMKEPCI